MIKKDEIGPEQIIEISKGIKGFLVIDNTKLGPGKGGIRMTPDVSLEEVFRLARTMTWKCALAELPFGGAKAGLVIEKDLSLKEKEMRVKKFSEKLKSICPSKYVAGPDINSGELEMKWFAEANGSMKSCTGKPIEMGGLPHELGSTGFGVAHAVDVAARYFKTGKKIAIQGFGNVGQFAAKFLSEMGYLIVAVADSNGCIYDENGLDIQKLVQIKEQTGKVINYAPEKICSDIFELPVDILIPAANADVINERNAKYIKAKLIVEGANIAITDEAKKILHSRKIFVVPDMIANAGGVISSYVEYIGGTEDQMHNIKQTSNQTKSADELRKKEQMFKLVEKKIRKNVKLLIDYSQKKNLRPHEAGIEIAKKRIFEKS